MREQIKDNILDLCNSMEELHGVIDRTTDIEQRMAYLQMCQEAAISIGNTLEQELNDSQSLIGILETYCEKIYYISQQVLINKEDMQLVQDSVLNMRRSIENIPITHRVVFFPYKAEMWDSLESVYLACAEDENCQCYVVPIPYYTRDAKTNQWVYCYEGDKFPTNIPVLHYKAYNIEMNKPDVAYVHNPYDEYNYVTRIEEEYFSYNLKKYVNKLVYIPYYANGGIVTPQQQNLPVHKHMDYMIGQSAEYKECFKGLPHYNKVLPLGSPKFDKILNMNKQHTETPMEWGEIDPDKKIVLINTTISTVLIYEELVLMKLKYVFEQAYQYTDILFVWRPHPLLESTYKAMRPDLLDKYLELKKYFLEDKIGILDETPDITKVIAVCDAYIGDVGSSVTNLCSVAGIPQFNFQYVCFEKTDEAVKQRLKLAKINYTDDSAWITEYDDSYIYKADIGLDNLTIEARVQEVGDREYLYPSSVSVGGNIYLAPMIAKKAGCYDTINNQLKFLPSNQNNIFQYYYVDAYKNNLVFLPFNSKNIGIYNLKKGKWKRYYDCITALKSGMQSIDDLADINGYALQDNQLWVCTREGNRILYFDLNTEKYRTYEVGQASYGYSCVSIDGDYLFLGETNTGKTIRYNVKTRETIEFDLPKDLVYIKGCKSSNYKKVLRPRRFLLDTGNYLVTNPEKTCSLIKINKKTGEITVICDDFLQGGFQHESEGEKNLFWKWNGVCNFAMVQEDGTLLIQRVSDRMMAKVSIEDETYEIFEIRRPPNDKAFDSESKGFYNYLNDYKFFRQETQNHDLDMFISDLLSGELESVKELQLEMAKRLNVNLEGTCGKNIHECIIKELRKG